MTIVGITGHQELPTKARIYAEQKIATILSELPPPLIGLTSLAEGTDQLFAKIILQQHGSLHVVVPSLGYEETFRNDASRRSYVRLLEAAETTTVLDCAEPGEAAYNAAGHFVVEHCDLLIAVWDGKPARGLGGTADAVAHARRLGRTNIIIWPKGVERE